MGIGARILVVDDDHDTIMVLAKLLAREGYEVTTADGAKSALQAADEKPFDLVLCDIGLGDGDGCDLLRELRSLKGIRGIAITGYGMPEDIERCREAGFLCQLIKPITIDQIQSAIQSAMLDGHPNVADAAAARDVSRIFG